MQQNAVNNILWVFNISMVNLSNLFALCIWLAYEERKYNVFKAEFKVRNLIYVLNSQQDDTLSTPSHQRSPNLSLNRSGSERVSKRSSLSLDLNANEDQLSDNSRSDSLEEGELFVCVSRLCLIPWLCWCILFTSLLIICSGRTWDSISSVSGKAVCEPGLSHQCWEDVWPAFYRF